MLSLLYYLVVSVPLPLVYTLCGTLAVTAFMFTKNLLQRGAVPPTLYCKDSALTKYILTHCQRFKEPFIPPLWAMNTHIQTCLPTLLPKVKFQYEREFLQMRDRGVIALDWGITGAEKLTQSSPVLLVLPGLSGDAQGLTFLCNRAMQKGFRPIVFNKRGHGNSPLTTPKLQSFGDPSDFRQVVKYVHSLFSEAHIVGVGVSAGSGLLVSYLGEYGSSCLLSAAVCISPGYDAETMFSTPITQPYDFLMLWGLRKLLCQHSVAMAKVIDVDAALKVRTLSEFDELVYCKSYGFRNMAEYWEKNNPMQAIDDVAIPVMCVTSLDDPICLKQNIPFDLFMACPHFLLLATRAGGHCGFLEAGTLEPWCDKVAIDYLQAVLEFLKKNES